MYATLVDTTHKACKMKTLRFFNDPPKTIFRNLESALKPYLNALNLIQRYDLFHFTSISPGIVQVKSLSEDEWITIDLRKGNFVLSIFFNINISELPNLDLNPEKRHDPWNKYFQYVPAEYQNQWSYLQPYN